MRELLFLLGACVLIGWLITLQIQIIKQQRLGLRLGSRILQIMRTNFNGKRKS